MTTLNVWLTCGGIFWVFITLTAFLGKLHGILTVSWFWVSSTIWVPLISVGGLVLFLLSKTDIG